MDLNIIGILVAIFSYVTIGVFHPIVIKCQYHFTDKIWPVFLVVGLLFVGTSLFVQNTVSSIMFSIVGASCLWSIHELREQTKRVEKGWFPKNPKHK